jgi:hypothetical protein
MSDSFEIENYSIVSSLNERTIYIKTIDKTLYICYESNIESKELRLSIEINNTYQLMTKCFRKETGYNVTMSINSGIMKMIFNAMVEGYLKINFEIILREKVMSNDSQLTMNFHRIEQQHEQTVKMLSKRLNQLERLVDAISYSEIYMLTHPHTNQHNSHVLYWKINTTDLHLMNNYWDYNKIKLFYNLEKIKFQSCNDITSFKSNNISNDNVQEMTLITLNSGSFRSLDGLNQFPKLQKLVIQNCSHLSEIVKIFNSYKHNIHTIDITNCTSINNTELMTYCQKNNIKLNLA